MSINNIGQIHVTVTDIDKAVEFYRDILGLQLVFQVPEQSMAFFDIGGVRLYLGLAEDPSFESKPLLYLTVDDIDAEFRRLRDLGVEMLGEPHAVHNDGTNEMWLSFLRTPEGSPLALMTHKPVS